MRITTLTAAVNRSRLASGAERGFTLIEALVAFVVLAVGIIGIISLLIMSKNSLHQSVQRTKAISLADAMVERIRINPTAVVTYENAGEPVGAGDLDDPPVDCAVATCTPDNLATYDLWTFEQALLGGSVTVDTDVNGDPIDPPLNVGGLIQPQACIRFDEQNGLLRSGMLNITIQWRGLEETSDAVPAGGFACGGADAGDDPYRRQVTVNTIVVDEAEF